MHGTGDQMASILEFRQPELQPRHVTAKSEGAVSADIVLFPGVRYERWAEAGDEPTKSRHRVRSRDHLDLDE